MKIPIHCAHTKKAKPADLQPHPRNPNRHTDQQIAMLAHIIEVAGWRSPVTVSKRSGLIIKGHARHQAAMLLDLKEIPVDEQDYKSEADEMADLVADNRMAELAELDYAMVKSIFEDTTIFPADFDLDLTGFDLFSRADIKKKYADEPEEVEAVPANGEVTHENLGGGEQAPQVIGNVTQSTDPVTGEVTESTVQPPTGVKRCPKCGYSFPSES